MPGIRKYSIERELELDKFGPNTTKTCQILRDLHCIKDGISLEYATMRNKTITGMNDHLSNQRQPTSSERA